MLQPVGAAVEKAGGLPQLDIQLDKGLDRKPSEGAAEEGKPGLSEGGGGGGGAWQGQGRGGVSTQPIRKVGGVSPQPSRGVDGTSQPPRRGGGVSSQPGGRGLARGGSSEDDLLELLCDEEEDEEGNEEPIPAANNLSDQSSEGAIGSNTFDSKLERLKRELLGNENGSGSRLSTGASVGSVGSKNGDVVKPSPYQAENGDDELSSAPMFDETETDKEEEAFNIQGNECYETTPTHSRDQGMRAKENVYSSTPGTNQEDTSVYETPIDAMGVGGMAGGRGPDTGKNVYEDMDAIDRMMSAEGGAGPGSASDSVFTRDGEEGHIYCDIPDGGMMSRQTLPPLPPIEQIELEEVAMFRNLPPLVCTAHLGDEVTLKKLADTASSVITEVVKHIHSSLGKY